MKPLIFIFALLSVMITNANAGPYPVVSSMTTYIGGPGSAAYFFDWAVIDIPAADQPAPYNWSFVLAHRHDNFPGGEDIVAFGGRPSTQGSCNPTGCRGIVLAGETFSQAAMRITENGTALQHGEIYHSGYGNGGECVGYIFLHPSASTTSTRWSKAVMPGSTCVYAPPGDDFCKITSPSIILDHGTLTVTDANGNETSQWVNMRCSTATKVTIRFASGIDYIPMQNNAKANIKVDGQSVGGKFYFPAGDTQVEIKSILEDITQAGDYTGNTVMIIEPV